MSGIPSYVPKAERARDRVLSDHEVRVLWQAMEAGHGIEKRTGLALCLAFLTLQRRRTIQLACWDQFRDGLWHMPAQNMKSGRPHIIPITPMVGHLLEQLRDLSDGSPWLFPGRRPDQPLTVRSLTKAFSRVAGACGGQNARLHDLRRTAATWAAGGRADRVVVGDLLHHLDGTVTAIYERGEHIEDRRRALERLERRLLRVLGHVGNIVDFPGCTFAQRGSA